MQALTEHGFWLVGALSGVGWLLAIWALIAVRSSHARLTQVSAQLQKEIGLLQAGAVSMGQRILLLEKRLPQQSSAANTDISGQPYAQATHLLASGLGLDEVASRCGLSRAEASLLDALRKRTS